MNKNIFSIFVPLLLVALTLPLAFNVNAQINPGGEAPSNLQEQRRPGAQQQRNIFEKRKQETREIQKRGPEKALEDKNSQERRAEQNHEGQHSASTQSEKRENLEECGPQPGAPGNWVCEDGNWINKSKFFSEKRQQQIKERREAAQKRAKQRRQQAVERRQERLQETKEKREEFRQKARERLSERKAEIADRLSERINEINNRMTDNYLRLLERLETVLLDKIESRAMNFEQRFDLDISSVEKDIARAQNRIKQARNSVLSQKETIYTVKINEGKSVGQAIRSTMLKMRSDQQGLRQNELRPARESVINVFQVLQEVITSENINPPKENAEAETETSSEGGNANTPDNIPAE